MGSSIEQLIKTIKSYDRNSEITQQLKNIQTQAENVLKEHHTLDLLYEGSPYYFEMTPLKAAIRTGSLQIFQKMISLGANPFFKPKPDSESAMEILANNYFSPFSVEDKKIPPFEWMMNNEDSPVFTWAKLNTYPQLFAKFQNAGLIPKKNYINVLPLHIAIRAGRMDLIQEVIGVAGSIQNSGDICKMSLLNPAIVAVLENKKNALEILKYLLEHGANTQTTDAWNLTTILQALTAQVFHLSNVKEQTVFELVQLLIQHGASLNITNPNNGNTPLMTAVRMGYKSLFDFFLDKANVTILNHQAHSKPNYLIFQLVDPHENKLNQLDIVALLSNLKKKGLDFGKTIDYNHATDPISTGSYNDRGEVFAKNMSLLHFYIDNLTYSLENPLESFELHLKLIQNLIVNGVNPHAKATFILTRKETDSYSYKTKEVKTSIELTASEYLRKIADKVLGHYSFNHEGFLIKTYANEQEFLKNITYKSKEDQTSLHKKFHQFRNLERVLSGEPPIPYSGFPNLEKINALALKSKQPEKQIQTSAESKPTLEQNDFNPKSLEAQLNNARAQHQQGNWKVLKKSIIDYVKNVDSLQDFLSRLEQFKNPLQLHYDITISSKGEVMKGSALYCFFHYFDPHKFPTSWETLRTYGLNTFGIDINLQYEQENLSLH